MISAARTNKRSRGFTLIEIVMVLAIAGVVMGGAVGFMVFSSDERALRNASGEVELMAKRARTISILQQTPYAMEFREGRVNLLPWAQAGQQDKKSKRYVFTEDTEAAGKGDKNSQYVLPPEMTISVRRWNSDEWHTTQKNAVHVWRFDPDGLCEPISVRLDLNKSWVIDTFHPLTATISDTESETR
ncbi:MAG: prepilin-type N-terminal cleavage/methylation domain-containing protein [Verrucomicrobiota bacterium]